MIPLRIAAEAPGAEHPFVVRLNSDYALRSTSHDAFLSSADDDCLEYHGPGGSLRLTGMVPDDLDGDVLLVIPGRRIAHRLIRSASEHNTLLVTERCDQLCVMCSQPGFPRWIGVHPAR